jgi:hypothetical protein
MLERVIQHDAVRSVLRRALCTGQAIGRRNHRNIGIECTMHERLIVSIAAHDDRRARARLTKAPGEPRGDRRLASAAHRQIADAERRHGRLSRRQQTVVIQCSTCRDADAIEGLGRKDRGTQNTVGSRAPEPGAFGEPARIRHRPMRRAT